MAVALRRSLRGTAAGVLGALALGVLGGASLGATASQGSKAIKISATTDAAGRMRSNGRAISIPVTVWCDSASTGEIDAVIEQRATHQRVVRNMAIGCDPQRQRVVLVFETTKPFVHGTVVLRFDVSAGFGEQFTTMHRGPISVTV